MNQHPNMQTPKNTPVWVNITNKFIAAVKKPKQNFVWFASNEATSALIQSVFITHESPKFKLGIIVVDLVSQALELKEILNYTYNNFQQEIKHLHCEILLTTQELPIISNTQANILIVPSFQLHNLFTNKFLLNNEVSFVSFHHVETILTNEFYVQQIKTQLLNKAHIFFRLTHKKKDTLQKIANNFNGFELLHPALLEESTSSTVKIENIQLPTFPQEPCVVISNQTQKRNIIQHLLINFNWQKIAIISKTKHAAHRIEEKLYRRKIRSKIIHAALPEDIQNHFVQKLNNQEIRVLFITTPSFDQLSLPELDAVFFYDPPEQESEFIHRLEFFMQHPKKPICVSLISDEELSWLNTLETNLGKTYPRVEVALPQTHKHINHQTPESDPTTKSASDEEPKNRSTKKINHKKPQRLNSKNSALRNTAINNPTAKPNNVSTNSKKTSRKATSNRNNIGNNEQQGIVNQNRLPFDTDSFEANISRENKRRVRKLFSGRSNINELTSTNNHFEQNPQSNKPKSDVKIVHRKRKAIEVDSNS